MFVLINMNYNVIRCLIENKVIKKWYGVVFGGKDVYWILKWIEVRVFCGLCGIL